MTNFAFWALLPQPTQPRASAAAHSPDTTALRYFFIKFPLRALTQQDVPAAISPDYT